MINTGFFGKSSGIPMGLQAVAAVNLAGGTQDIKKMTSATTAGGTRQEILVMSSRGMGNGLRPVMITLTNLDANAAGNIQGSLKGVGLDELYDLIIKDKPESEILSYINTRFELYLKNLDPNKFGEVKKDRGLTNMNNLIDACKQANLDPQIVEQLRRISNEFVDYKKKPMSNLDAGKQAESEGATA